MWLIIIGVLLALLAGVGVYAYLNRDELLALAMQSKKDASSSSSSSPSSQGAIGPVPLEDFVSMFNRLKPDSTHMEVLFAILAMKDTLEKAALAIDKIDELREKRKKQLEDEKKKNQAKVEEFDDLVNAEGWGQEEDESAALDEDGEPKASSSSSDAVKKAKEAEKRKEAELARLRKATGQDLPPLEGLDEGVLGQQWVMKTLETHGAWPPKLGNDLGNELFPYQPKKKGRSQKLKPLDHPGFVRCLCMTLGRLHSTKLNSHPALVQAGQEKRVDETYFKGSMEFRQRVGIILDAALRVALTVQSFSLFSTIVETLAAFKVGCDPRDEKSLPAFNGSMARQYNTLPRLEIGPVRFEALPDPQQALKPEPGQPPKPAVPGKLLTELVAGEQAVVVLPVDRKHAKAFTDAKVAQCKKQGIPPEIAMQGYREAWWFLVRWEKEGQKTDDEKGGAAIEPNGGEKDMPRQFLNKLRPDVVKVYESTPLPERVRTAFPLMVQNISQKEGAVKVRMTPPPVPGKYIVVLDIKSQDFLGADQTIRVPIQVKENVNNNAAAAAKKNDGDGDDDDDDKKKQKEDEPKKDK